MYQRVLEHVEESHAHLHMKSLLMLLYDLQFHVLSGLCKADLVLLVVVQRSEMQRSFFVSVPLNPLHFSTQFFYVPFSIASNISLLSPLSKSLTASPCPLATSHFHTKKSTLPMMPASTPHELLKSTLPNLPPCYCLHTEGAPTILLSYLNLILQVSP